MTLKEAVWQLKDLVEWANGDDVDSEDKRALKRLLDELDIPYAA